jgi:hypothetical protein
MQRLLVSEHGGGEDANADCQLLVAEHDHGAEQEDNWLRHLGGQPLAVRTWLGIDEIARSDEGAHDEDGGSQDPGGRRLARQPAGDRA